MNVLIAVKGSESPHFFEQVARLVPLAQADQIILAHVIDTKPRAELEFGRERYLGRHPLSRRREADLIEAESERAQAALQFARQALVAQEVPEEPLREVILRGKPNEELRHLADRNDVDLIVVGGRSGKPGPHSVGKTARFLIDHAPRSALLVRPHPPS